MKDVQRQMAVSLKTNGGKEMKGAQWKGRAGKDCDGRGQQGKLFYKYPKMAGNPGKYCPIYISTPSLVLTMDVVGTPFRTAWLLHLTNINRMNPNRHEIRLLFTTLTCPTAFHGRNHGQNKYASGERQWMIPSSLTFY